MSREYRFKIEIQLNSPIKKKKILDCNVSYPYSQRYQDHFLSKKTSIMGRKILLENIDVPNIENIDECNE